MAGFGKIMEMMVNKKVNEKVHDLNLQKNNFVSKELFRLMDRGDIKDQQSWRYEKQKLKDIWDRDHNML